MLFSLYFLIPTQAFRAQAVTLNKTTEIANATAYLFTYCFLVCPKCGNNVSRDAGIRVSVEDPGSCPGWYCIFKGWFIQSWEGGRTVPAVPPLLHWLTAWRCFHWETCASRLSQQLWSKQKRSGKEKWFTGRGNKRELGVDARPGWRQNFRLSLLKMCRALCVSFMCKLMMSFAICKGRSGREQIFGLCHPTPAKGWKNLHPAALREDEYEKTQPW